MSRGATPRPRRTPKDCHVAVPTVDAIGNRWVVVPGLDYLSKTEAINKAAAYPGRARAMRTRDGSSMVLFDNYHGAEIPAPTQKDVTP